MPAPTLLRDVSEVLRGGAAWSDAKVWHPIPATGGTLAVLGQGFLVEILPRRDLPEQGDLRVDMKRAPVLDVRLVGVPPTLRERMLLQLQVEYGPVEEAVNRASILIGDRAPKIMSEDRLLVPLAMLERGRVRVFAKSRHSNVSYPARAVPFEPVSQILTVDIGTLVSACSLADLTLTLGFPYAHPAGEITVSLEGSQGDTITHQKFDRAGASQRILVFKDLPRTMITPVVSIGHGADPTIRLEPVDTGNGPEHVRREVVAEGSLRVFLSGGRDPPPGKVSILVRDALGMITVAAWPTGAEHTFRRLPAMVGSVQAIDYEDRLCSPVVGFASKADAVEIALPLVPAGKIVVPAGAFGAAIRFLDARYAAGDESRVFLQPHRASTLWLPTGAPLVQWDGGRSVLRVDAGVINTWIP